MLFYLHFSFFSSSNFQLTCCFTCTSLFFSSGKLLIDTDAYSNFACSPNFFFQVKFQKPHQKSGFFACFLPLFFTFQVNLFILYLEYQFIKFVSKKYWEFFMLYNMFFAFFKILQYCGTSFYVFLT